MPESKAKKIADAAEMIVDGYAVLCHRKDFRVVSLYTGHVALVSAAYEILATDMDDIEATIAVNKLKDNIEFVAA